MNCKILYLEGSYPINTRSQRVIESLENHNVHICAWDRSGVTQGQGDLTNYSIHSSPKVGYGNKFTKAIYLLSYANYFRRVLKKENPDVILASHWDMLLIAAIFKGERKLIYDNIDIPESKFFFIEKIILILENISLYRADRILLASRFYNNLYKRECIILENLPVVKNKVEIKRNILNRKIKIGFVGSVRHYELLKNLILSIGGNSLLELNFYGYGIATEKLKKICYENFFENVVFHGAFKYSEIESIYNEIDILWAAYPYKTRNVKYAISNKFYESIYYTIPCLFSIDTMLGDYVKNKKIGVTVDPYSVDDIKKTISLTIEHYDQIYQNLIACKNDENIDWGHNRKVLQRMINGLMKYD